MGNVGVASMESCAPRERCTDLVAERDQDVAGSTTRSAVIGHFPVPPIAADQMLGDPAKCDFVVPLPAVAEQHLERGPDAPATVGSPVRASSVVGDVGGLDAAKEKPAVRVSSIDAKDMPGGTVETVVELSNVSDALVVPRPDVDTSSAAGATETQKYPGERSPGAPDKIDCFGMAGPAPTVAASAGEAMEKPGSVDAVDSHGFNVKFLEAILDDAPFMQLRCSPRDLPQEIARRLVPPVSAADIAIIDRFDSVVPPRSVIGNDLRACKAAHTVALVISYATKKTALAFYRKATVDTIILKASLLLPLPPGKLRLETDGGAAFYGETTVAGIVDGVAGADRESVLRVRPTHRCWWRSGDRPGAPIPPRPRDRGRSVAARPGPEVAGEQNVRLQLTVVATQATFSISCAPSAIYQQCALKAIGAGANAADVAFVDDYGAVIPHGETFSSLDLLACAMAETDVVRVTCEGHPIEFRIHSGASVKAVLGKAEFLLVRDARILPPLGRIALASNSGVADVERLALEVARESPDGVLVCFLRAAEEELPPDFLYHGRAEGEMLHCFWIYPPGTPLLNPTLWDGYHADDMCSHREEVAAAGGVTRYRCLGHQPGTVETTYYTKDASGTIYTIARPEKLIDEEWESDSEDADVENREVDAADQAPNVPSITLEAVQYNVMHFAKLASQVVGSKLQQTVDEAAQFNSWAEAHTKLKKQVQDLMNSSGRALADVYMRGSDMFQQKYNRALDRPPPVSTDRVAMCLRHPMREDSYAEFKRHVDVVRHAMDEVFLKVMHDQLEAAKRSFSDVAGVEDEGARP